MLIINKTNAIGIYIGLNTHIQDQVATTPMPANFRYIKKAASKVSKETKYVVFDLSIYSNILHKKINFKY